MTCTGNAKQYFLCNTKVNSEAAAKRLSKELYIVSQLTIQCVIKHYRQASLCIAGVPFLSAKFSRGAVLDLQLTDLQWTEVPLEAPLFW